MTSLSFNPLTKRQENHVILKLHLESLAVALIAVDLPIANQKLNVDVKIISVIGTATPSDWYVLMYVLLNT